MVTIAASSRTTRRVITATTAASGDDAAVAIEAVLLWRAVESASECDPERLTCLFPSALCRTHSFRWSLSLPPGEKIVMSTRKLFRHKPRETSQLASPKRKDRISVSP
jgi:hypothetical protein